VKRGPRDSSRALDDFVVLGDLWHPGPPGSPICDDARVLAVLAGKAAGPRPEPSPEPPPDPQPNPQPNPQPDPQPEPPPPPEPIPGIGRLSGRVLRRTGPRGTPTPLAGAEVILSAERAGLDLSTTSDAEGRWSFGILQDMDATLVARFGGRDSRRVQVMVTRLLPNPDIDLTIRD
jgi:hypothetical protein